MKAKGAVAIFTKRAQPVDEVVRRLHEAESIYLFLDYDGTLTPIRRLPSQARLSRKAQLLLRQVIALPDTFVSIVTGRSMKTIRSLVSQRTLTLAANHGLHLRYTDGTEWIHPDAVESMDILALVRRKIAAQLRSIPGAYVENKGLTLTIHYRNCTRADAGLVKKASAAVMAATAPMLRMTTGKKVLEIRPQVLWGKKNAVMKLLQEERGDADGLPVFMGDDATDEEVFTALRSEGVTVHVGGSKATEAEFFVNTVEEIHRLLELLIEVRTNKKAEFANH